MPEENVQLHRKLQQLGPCWWNVAPFPTRIGQYKGLDLRVDVLLTPVLCRHSTSASWHAVFPRVPCRNPNLNYWTIDISMWKIRLGLGDAHAELPATLWLIFSINMVRMSSKPPTGTKVCTDSRIINPYLGF